MTRRKSKTIEQIGSREEAAVLANEYAALTADIASIEAERLKAKAAIDADCDERIGNRADSQAALFKRLKLWWLGGGADLVAGKKRSAPFGGVKIGLRKPTPSLKWAKGLKPEDLIKAIGCLRWSRKGEFLRSGKTTLDKEAIIKAIVADDKEAKPTLLRIGFETSQIDEFFIDIPSKEVAPGTSGAADNAPAAPISQGNAP